MRRCSRFMGYQDCVSRVLLPAPACWTRDTTKLNKTRETCHTRPTPKAPATPLTRHGVPLEPEGTLDTPHYVPHSPIIRQASKTLRCHFSATRALGPASAESRAAGLRRFIGPRQKKRREPEPATASSQPGAQGRFGQSARVAWPARGRTLPAREPTGLLPPPRLRPMRVPCLGDAR